MGCIWLRQALSLHEWPQLRTGRVVTHQKRLQERSKTKHRDKAKETKPKKVSKFKFKS